MKEVQEMGDTTSKVFAGQYESETTREMYTETAEFFADEIRKRLNNEREYTLVDVSSFQGELMADTLKRLPEYRFHTIAVDVDHNALTNNVATTNRIVAAADNLPFSDHGIDIAMVRYVLQWNSAEKQKKILAELARTTKEFAIIEHIGSDVADTDGWRKHMDILVGGEAVSKLKRGEHFFSSRDEIEEWMKQAGIMFERIRDREIHDASNAYIERFALDENESEQTRQILGDKDFFRQTDWIIYPKQTK